MAVPVYNTKHYCKTAEIKSWCIRFKLTLYGVFVDLTQLVVIYSPVRGNIYTIFHTKENNNIVAIR